MLSKALDKAWKGKWTATGAVAGGAMNYDPSNPYSSVAKGALGGAVFAKGMQHKWWDKSMSTKGIDAFAAKTTNKIFIGSNGFPILLFLSKCFY